MKSLIEFKTHFTSGPDRDSNVITYDAMKKAFIDMDPVYIEELDAWYRVSAIRSVKKGVIEVTFTRGDQEMK